MTFTAHDLRQARLTQLAESGNLTGAAYLAGHKRVSTTALYVARTGAQRSAFSQPSARRVSLLRGQSPLVLDVLQLGFVTVRNR